MNKEYILLSDNEVIVSDEKGKMQSKYFNDSQNVEEILILENKIEKLDNELKWFNKQLESNKEVVPFVNKMMKIQFILVPIIIAIFFFGGGISHIDNFVSYGIAYGTEALVMGSIFGGTVLCAGKYFKKKSLKEIKFLEEDRKNAENLKNKYEKELNVEKSKININNREKVNNPISLEKQNKIAFKEIDDEIYTYEEPKKLVLMRRNKK